MKEIVKIGVLASLFIGCGGGGSSSPSKGGLSDGNPLNRAAGGFIDSQNYRIVTTPADGLSAMMCQGGKGMLLIKNSVVTGMMMAGLSRPCVVFGTYVPETGKLTGGFKEMEQMVGNYSGLMNIDGGKGTWSDDFGCHGTWEALKD